MKMAAFDPLVDAEGVYVLLGPTLEEVLDLAALVIFIHGINPFTFENESYSPRSSTYKEPRSITRNLIQLLCSNP